MKPNPKPVVKLNPKPKFLAEVSQPNPGFFNPSHLLLLTTLFNSLNIFLQQQPTTEEVYYIYPCAPHSSCDGRVKCSSRQVCVCTQFQQLCKLHVFALAVHTQISSLTEVVI